jgi:hypothetical protein
MQIEIKFKWLLNYFILNLNENLKRNNYRKIIFYLDY